MTVADGEAGQGADALGGGEKLQKIRSRERAGRERRTETDGFAGDHREHPERKANFARPDPAGEPEL